MSNRHEDYLIGIICLSQMERVAMEVFLDEKHAILPLDQRDRNVYTLGSMCGHNVAIASPPSGMYGVVTAAVAARDMIWSFSAIRFCLSVGFGSGIPSENNDVRLGDVVVGTPSRNYGGVVQIDFARQNSSKDWERVGWLNSPPHILLRAVSELDMQDQLDELNLSRDISQVLETYPRMRERYKSPGPGRDLLFHADHAHAHPGESCSSCDPSKLVARADRDYQQPMIHQGLIANTNANLKDAKFRDEIGTELGAICFDTGTLDFVNILPSLVIRGVADYADTHKNTEWQDYAALAASAYTKQLLSLINTTTNRGIAAAASLNPDLSSAHRLLDLEVDDGTSTSSIDDRASTSSVDDRASTSSYTSAGTSETSDAGIRISAAKRIAHVLVSDERLRSICVSAALRLAGHMLQWNISVALGVFSRFLKKQPQTSVIRALRWLFSRHRMDIATSMTDNVCEQAGFLGVEQVETAPLSDVTLMRLLKNRFPAANVTNTAVSRVHSEEVPTLDLGEIDLETQELPDKAILADLGQLDEILCRGKGFEDMLGKLKELLLPPVHVLLENNLGTYLAERPRDSEITCMVEWELLQLVDFEGLDVEDIDCLFTLSGDLESARADPLASHEIWETGKELLELVKTCLAMAANNVFDSTHTELGAEADSTHQTQIQLFTAKMNTEKEYAVVNIAGSSDYITTTVKQLAWLTATLRVPHGEMLTVSYINFQPQRTQTGGVLEGVFRMSLWEQEKIPQPNSEPGQCWTELLAQSVLAYGFPSAKDRPKSMRGLEIPFNIMASFAGIRFPLLLGERLAFASETHVLVPEIVSEDSIQWHFETIESAIRQTTTTYKVNATGMESVSSSNVQKYRAFLGYSRLSEVVIGTAEFCNVNITASKVPRTRHHLTFKHEGPLSAGASIKGCFTATVGTTWKFRKSELAQIEGSTISLDDVLKRSAETPALLNLSTESLEVVSGSNTPASRSSDGGKAAYEAVKAARNLEVHFGTGEPKKYPEIVREFIDQLEQRKKQRRANQSSSEISLSLKKGLRGWNYTDVQEKRFEFWEREVPTDILHSRPVWWQLFRESNITILFAGDIPQPIRICHDQISSSCTSWDVIPAGHHLLLANVRNLQRLTSDVGDAGKKNPTRFMLAADLAWARPAKSRLFDTDCTLGGRCNPLQTMREPTILWLQETKARSFRTTTYLPHPGQLEPFAEGLVLFADDPSAIGDRPCQIVKHCQDVPEFQLRFVVGAILSPLLALMVCRFVITNYGELSTLIKLVGLGQWHERVMTP